MRANRISRRRIVATFSIVAFDPEAEALGVAVQSKFLAAGALVPYARAGVGAVATQALANVAHGGWKPRRPPGSSDEEAIRALREQRDHLQRRRYGSATARINRDHAVQSGAEPVTAVEEALRLVAEVREAIDAGDRDRVLRLVGRI